MSKNPVAELKRILMTAIVIIATDDVTDQQGIDMAFACIMNLLEATPKSSIFYPAIEEVEHAVEVLIDGPIVGTSGHIKRLANRLEARIRILKAA
jgi:hypothetical protein